MVEGHDSRLGQVFNNLIDNARSFSPPDGTVTATLRRVRDEVEIVVEDEGPGIPPHALERVFERFYTDRPDQGFGQNSGLGLSISRQIVEAHRGRIRAENRPASRRARSRRRRPLRRPPAGASADRRLGTVHATCVVIGEAGVLLRGPSGSGKSTLARRLVEGAADAAASPASSATTGWRSRPVTAASSPAPCRRSPAAWRSAASG